MMMGAVTSALGALRPLGLKGDRPRAVAVSGTGHRGRGDAALAMGLAYRRGRARLALLKSRLTSQCHCQV